MLQARLDECIRERAVLTELTKQLRRRLGRAEERLNELTKGHGTSAEHQNQQAGGRGGEGRGAGSDGVENSTNEDDGGNVPELTVEVSRADLLIVLISLPSRCLVSLFLSACLLSCLRSSLSPSHTLPLTFDLLGRTLKSTRYCMTSLQEAMQCR